MITSHKREGYVSDLTDEHDGVVTQTGRSDSPADAA